MRRGWCPGVFTPMESGDGLLVRVKPPRGRIEVGQAQVLAAAAGRWGNGVIGLTSRGNLQVRGLRAATVERFAAAMVASGLALADPVAERRRRVIASPLGGEDAAAIERGFLAEPGLDGLAEKFVVLAGAGCAADVTIRAGRIGLAGTGCSARSDDPVAAVLRLAHLVLARGAGRMAKLVRAIGAEAVFAGAGLRAEGAMPAAEGARIGTVAPGLFAAGVELGVIEAVRLADLASRFGVLRVAPWRALVVDADVAVAPALAALGLIVDADDPRRLVTACVGRPRCGRATVDASGDAARLSPGCRVHVSGCAKGCGAPADAAVMFVGRNGSYDVVRDGRTVARGVMPDSFNEWIPKALPLAGVQGAAPPALP